MSVVEQVQQLEAHASGLIIGQSHLINRMIIALLCDGHLLVEGAPGLAKTRAIKVLSESIEGDFHRLQFTPDLLPADLTGTDIYRPQEGTFEFRKGPLFHNLILGGRNQPRAGKSSVGLARGHGRTPDNRRGSQLRTRRPVHGDGDAKPDRARGHVSLARSTT